MYDTIFAPCLFMWLLLKCGLMSQDQLIKLVNKDTKEVYWTRKNKKLVERKIELKKYSSKLRKRVIFKEAKK